LQEKGDRMNIFVMLFLLCLVSVSASAEETDRFGGFLVKAPQFYSENSVEYPCAPNSIECFKIKGVISKDTVSSVKQCIRTLEKSGLGHAPRVLLDSHGGDINSAIEIGRLFRKKNVAAMVPGNSVCHSACVFLLAGAKYRNVFGPVGIHRMFPVDTTRKKYSDAQKQYRQRQEFVKKYLEDMNIPEQLFDALTRTPPEKIRILTTNELDVFGLNRWDPVAEEIANASGARRYGLTTTEYLKRKSLVEKHCEAVWYPDSGEDAETFMANSQECVSNIMLK